MPNRMLRDWTDSEKVNALSWQGEVLLVRLIMKADDYGRFTANPKLLKSFLFPLKDGIRDADISRFLAECERAGLIRVYTSDAKPFLEISNFNQRMRAKVSRYPSINLTSNNQPIDSRMTDTCQTDDGLRREAGGVDENSPPITPQGEDSEISNLLKSGISKMYNRKESTTWSEKEKKKLKEVSKRVDALEEFHTIEALYESGTYEFFRRDIITLLNNWPGEVDRARLKGYGNKSLQKEVS
jgi:hypothetical protein